MEPAADVTKLYTQTLKTKMPFSWEDVLVVQPKIMCINIVSSLPGYWGIQLTFMPSGAADTIS